MMNRVKEEAMNKMTIGERQRPTVRKMDTEDIHTVEREGTKYDDDTQGWGKGPTESEYHQSEEESLPTVQAPSPKRPKKLKVEKPGEKPQERRKSRMRAVLPKSQ
jgi:hypothetical protein